MFPTKAFRSRQIILNGVGRLLKFSSRLKLAGRQFEFEAVTEGKNCITDRFCR